MIDTLLPSAHDWSAIVLTLQLAFISTLILLLIGSPLAWWLSQSRSAWKPVIEAIVALPLILPPTVLGFYLLVLLSPQGVIGSALAYVTDERLVFSFSGLVLGSVIYSLPFVVQPLHNAFHAIGKRPLEVAATLRATPWDCFISVVLPLAKPGYLTAAVLGFAHTVGEFGMVLMIGGNIPGKTQVISIAIYDHVESLQYTQAHVLSGGLLLLSFVTLLLLYRFNHAEQKVLGKS